jgi:predicted O-methyltransferase YrrM
MELSPRAVPQDVKDEYDTIYPRLKGLMMLHYEEGLTLFYLAKTSLPIVEIGSWIGGSTILLAQACKETIYAIDPHEGYLARGTKNVFKGPSTYITFQKNLALWHITNVILVREYSQSKQALNAVTAKSIGLLFIDGLHTYDGARSDLEMYEDKVSDDGFICMHDMNKERRCPGLSQLQREILVSPKYTDFKLVDTLLSFRKCLQIS